MPAAVGGRVAAQVDRDIEHRAMDAAHQLGLGMGCALEMQPTHRAASHGAGVVDLGDRTRPARGRQLGGAEQPVEESARVALAVPIDAVQTGQRQGFDGEAPGGHDSAS